MRVVEPVDAQQVGDVEGGDELIAGGVEDANGAVRVVAGGVVGVAQAADDVVPCARKPRGAQLLVWVGGGGAARSWVAFRKHSNNGNRDSPFQKSTEHGSDMPPFSGTCET